MVRDLSHFPQFKLDFDEFQILGKDPVPNSHSVDCHLQTLRNYTFSVGLSENYLLSFRSMCSHCNLVLTALRTSIILYFRIIHLLISLFMNSNSSLSLINKCCCFFSSAADDHWPPRTTTTASSDDFLRRGYHDSTSNRHDTSSSSSRHDTTSNRHDTPSNRHDSSTSRRTSRDRTDRYRANGPYIDNSGNGTRSARGVGASSTGTSSGSGAGSWSSYESTR